MGTSSRGPWPSMKRCCAPSSRTLPSTWTTWPPSTAKPAAPRKPRAWSRALPPSGHPRPQLDHFAIHSEPAMSVMVDGLGILLRGVGPSLEYFKDEKIVPVHETSITHLALEIRKTLGDQRRRHALGWHPRQTQRFELLHVAARAVADFHNFGRQLQRRNGDHALFRRPQRGKTEIGVADETGNQRRFKLDHHMPGHRHDVGAALVGGRQQDHRARFEQLIDFR